MRNLKSKILAGLLGLLLLGPFGPGAPTQPAFAAGVAGVGFAEETLTVSSTALSITSGLCEVRGRSTPALLEVLTNGIFFTLNSPTATPDSGDYAAPFGTIISVERSNYIRMIRQSSDSSVKVTCFRSGQLPTENSYDKSGAGVSASGASDVNVAEMNGVTVTMGASVIGTGVQTVTIATDDPVNDAAVELAAAINSTRLDITVDSTADITLQIADGDVPGNAGVLTANVPRVTIATDDEINDDLDAIRVATEAINTKLVTGTVIGDVNLGATDNAVLDTIADGIEAEMTGTQDVTIQVADTDVSVSNPVFVRLSDGASAVDAATDDAAAGTSLNVVGGIATPTDTSVDADDAGQFAMSLDRRQHIDSDLHFQGTAATTGASVIGTGVQTMTIATDDPVNDAAVELAAAINSSRVDVTTQPFSAVLELGITELVGINEAAIATLQYGDEFAITLTGTSGEILKVCMFTTEDQTGAILTEDETLLIFDVDPTITIADAALDAANYPTIIAQISFAAADWHEDTAGAVNCVVVADSYHTGTLFGVLFHDGATTINSAANDDEQYEINLWYRRDS